MSRRERQPPRSPASSRLVVLTALLSVVAILASGAALGMALTRDSGSNGCGTVAWNAAPAMDALPSGWAIAADRLLVGVLNTTLVGPTPSGSTRGRPCS